jgi:hypothetical protein
MCVALTGVAALTGCGGEEVACLDTDSQPTFCYEADACFGGDASNAPDEEHADTTCADLGYAVQCGDDDFYSYWAQAACSE